MPYHTSTLHLITLDYIWLHYIHMYSIPMLYPATTLPHTHGLQMERRPLKGPTRKAILDPKIRRIRNRSCGLSKSWVMKESSPGWSKRCLWEDLYIYVYIRRISVAFSIPLASPKKNLTVPFPLALRPVHFVTAVKLRRPVFEGCQGKATRFGKRSLIHHGSSLDRRGSDELARQPLLCLRSELPG